MDLLIGSLYPLHLRHLAVYIVTHANLGPCYKERIQHLLNVDQREASRSFKTSEERGEHYSESIMLCLAVN